MATVELGVYVTAMGTLLTITVFLEGFSRARLHRGIDIAGRHGDQVLDELASASPVDYQRAPDHLATGAGVLDVFALPRVARWLRQGLVAAVVTSAGFYGLLLAGLADDTTSAVGSPDDWDARWVVASAFLVAQVAIAVWAYVDLRLIEEDLVATRLSFLARLVARGETLLHPAGSEPLPNSGTCRQWAAVLDAARTALNPTSPETPSLASLQARFRLALALGLQALSRDDEDARRDRPHWQFFKEAQDERASAALLLRSLPQTSHTADSLFALTSALGDSFGRPSDEQLRALTQALGHHSDARIWPARWVVPTNTDLWDAFVAAHQDPLEFLDRARLDQAVDLIEYTAADPESARHFIYTAVHATLRTDSWYGSVGRLLARAFRDCDANTMHLLYGRLRRRLVPPAAVLGAVATAVPPGKPDLAVRDLFVSDLAALMVSDPKQASLIGNRSRHIVGIAEAARRAFPSESEARSLILWLRHIEESSLPETAQREAVAVARIFAEGAQPPEDVSSDELAEVVRLLVAGPDTDRGRIYTHVAGRLTQWIEAASPARPPKDVDPSKGSPGGPRRKATAGAKSRARAPKPRATAKRS